MDFSTKGVFTDLINDEAFLDRVVISLTAKKKEGSSGPEVGQIVNRAIGGIGRKYARKETGVLACGNSYDLNYGRLQLVLPQMILTVRSDQSPTTAKIMTNAVNAICEREWQAKVSLVELTFDCTGVDIEYFRRSIFSSAHSFRSVCDDKGRCTYYIGARTSPWQVRIYQKTQDVVRLEFVLRRPFLRQQRITTLSDLRKIRTLNLKHRLWLRELNTTAARTVEVKVAANDQNGVRQRILARWLRDLPLRQGIQAVKKHFGGVPRRLTTISLVDEGIRRMQRRLIV